MAHLSEDFGIDSTDSWASYTLVRVIADPPKRLVSREDFKEWFATQRPVGYIFVINRKEYGKNASFKGPGGRRDEGDQTPKDTACRETAEEAGIVADVNRYVYIGKKRNPRSKRVLWDCLFTLTIMRKEARTMNGNHPKNEGEIPNYFTVRELHRQVTRGVVFKKHFEEFMEHKLIEPSNENRTKAKAAA